MKPETQVEILERLLDLCEKQRDEDMLPAVVRLPVQNYTSPSIFESEIAHVFKNYPLVAGHASRVRDPGSYILSDWDRFPFLVVRDREGVLRGFVNMCRHRGARLFDGREEKLKAFVCPFHGWSYNLDGSLKAMTRASEFPGLNVADYGLIKLPVCERLGLIWIHPQPERHAFRRQRIPYAGPHGRTPRNLSAEHRPGDAARVTRSRDVTKAA